jgi:hypothetical protein
MPVDDENESGAAALPVTTKALDGAQAAGAVFQKAGELVASMAASVWSAAANVTAQSDYSTQSNEETSRRLLEAVQLRLADTHADLFAVTVARLAPKKRLRDALERSSRTKPERVWRPTRPALAIEIATLIQREVGLVQVPAEKVALCALPMKIFAKEIAAHLTKSAHATDFTERSLVYAVNEVCAAVVSEADTSRAAEPASASTGGVVALHGCTDAAWTGTAARGSGIAMDGEGKVRVLLAAQRVAERLLQPLKLSALPR